MTKNTLIIAIIVCFLSAPLQATAYSPPNGHNFPPVEQALVREGDFALKLAQALGLGTQADEVEAMGALAAAGVAPGAGWIADYPVTPDILGELEVSVVDAADAGRLAASREEALYAFQRVAAGFDLAVAAAQQEGDLQKEPPRAYPPYTDPAVVHHHYYNVGPPVVTYYPPPPDYFYLYGWVPYPFYWHSFWFPGFFILHDFHRVVFVRQRRVKVVTNHVFVPRARRAVVVDHRSRTRGRFIEERRAFSDRRRVDSLEGRRGAQAIVERSRSRERSRDSSRTLESRGRTGGRSGIQRQESRREDRAFTGGGPGGAGAQRSGRPEALTGRGAGPGASRSGRTESFNRPSTGRSLERRSEALSGNRGVRSFNRPDSSSGRGGRSFDRPPTSGRSRSDAFTANPGRSSQSFSGSRPSAIQRGPSRGSGASLSRPSGAGGGTRSFSAPSMRSSRGGGRVGAGREMRAGGGGGRSGGSARGGSSRR